MMSGGRATEPARVRQGCETAAKMARMRGRSKPAAKRQAGAMGQPWHHGRAGLMARCPADLAAVKMHLRHGVCYTGAQGPKSMLHPRIDGVGHPLVV